MALKITRAALRRFNGADRSYDPRDLGERGMDTARYDSKEDNKANLARYHEGLRTLHEAIEELARLAVTNTDMAKKTSHVEVLKPMAQDRLHGHITGSRRHATLDLGQGFTLTEYLTGSSRSGGPEFMTGYKRWAGPVYKSGNMQSGGSDRRFHVASGPSYDDIRGIALPYAITKGDSDNITKRAPVRGNGRKEDLAIALDGSRRTWNGVYVPHDVAKPGVKIPPAFGVREDPKISNFDDNVLESHLPIVPGRSTSAEIVGKTRWLDGLEERVRNLH